MDQRIVSYAMRKLDMWVFLLWKCCHASQVTISLAQLYSETFDNATDLPQLCGVGIVVTIISGDLHKT